MSAIRLRYILDTDIVTAHQAGNAIVSGQVARLLPDEVGTTVISMHEQLRGWLTEIDRRSQGFIRTRNSVPLVVAYRRLQETGAYYAQLSVLPFGSEAAAQYLILRQQRQHGGPGMHDLQIAAITLVAGMVLVTNNRRHFAQIPGLQVANWLD